MASKEKLIERAILTSKCCILPELIENFDSRAIGKEDFCEFNKMINENLHTLLDILYQNEFLLTSKAYDSQFIEIRSNLVQIACEQLSPNPYFRIDEEKILLQTLENLIFNHIQKFEDSVFMRCIQTFKEKLIEEDIWKRQMGLIHSVPMFCDMLLHNKLVLMTDDNLMFFLSIGSKLIEHFDIYYKTIGLKIYRHLLEFVKREQLKSLNIYGVMYSEIFHLIQHSSELDFNDHLYECLYRIVSSENSCILNSHWCEFDDVLSKLLVQYSFEAESNLCKKLLYQIIRLCGIGNESYKFLVLEDLQNFNTMDFEKYFMELKSQFTNSNDRVERWTKKIMELLLNESSKCLLSVKDSFLIINTLHMLYIITILTMEPVSFSSRLVDFIKKFMVSLMRIARTFKENKEILKSIHNLINTIESHAAKLKETDFLKSFEIIRRHKILNC